MNLLELLVFYMGIYGISWSIIYAKPLQFLTGFLKEFNPLYDLLTCVVCISFWVALPFTYLYFKQELWHTQVLLHFSSVTFTWVVAHFLDD